MIPIEKNIIVVDEQGNEYEATYPKRAKGLVKNGRARFIGENKICLACPPQNFETEDIKMSENIDKIEIVQDNNNKPQYTVEYILLQMEEIQKQTSYLNEAIAKLSAMGDGDSGNAGSPGNILGAEKAKAFGDIVRCRETTNQQMLRMYEKMFDNLTISKQSASLEVDKWNTICRLADIACNDDDFASERAEMLDSIRQIIRENK